MSTNAYRHWDAPLLPSHLEKQIRQQQREKERAPQQNRLNQCILEVFDPHVLKFCGFQSRITLSHTSSRLFFILSRKVAWEDLLELLSDKVADIDLDLRDAMETQDSIRVHPMRRIPLQKKQVADVLALRKQPDENLKILLRVLRSLLFDAKFEKWDKYLKDMRMNKRDLVWEQMCHHFDEDKVSGYNRRMLNKFVPKMDLTLMRRKSASCGEIVEWLHEIHRYVQEKESAAAFAPERLYQKKLKLCKQMALIQKKLEYQWSFKPEESNLLRRDEEEELVNDFEELSVGDEEDEGEEEEESVYEVLTAPGETQ